MSTISSGVTGGHVHAIAGSWRGIAVAIGVAAAVAGCGSSVVTPYPAPTATVAAATATASATPTPTPTPTPAPTDTPTATPTATPTPAPTATHKPTPTPLPALAIGLCTGAQLRLSIAYWVGDPGAGTVYAHLTARNASSASCNMRGTSEAEILNASGAVIASAGSGAAKVKSTDPVYTLAPNGTINTITQWGNWCKAAPSQNIKVAMVEPFGLGTIVAPANGAAPVPTCYASGSPSMVSSEAWLP
jgi:hypothetical protein